MTLFTPPSLIGKIWLVIVVGPVDILWTYIYYFKRRFSFPRVMQTLQAIWRLCGFPRNMQAHGRVVYFCTSSFHVPSLIHLLYIATPSIGLSHHSPRLQALRSSREMASQGDFPAPSPSIHPPLPSPSPPHSLSDKAALPKLLPVLSSYPPGFEARTAFLRHFVPPRNLLLFVDGREEHEVPSAHAPAKRKDDPIIIIINDDDEEEEEEEVEDDDDDEAAEMEESFDDGLGEGDGDEDDGDDDDDDGDSGGGGYGGRDNDGPVSEMSVELLISLTPPSL